MNELIQLSNRLEQGTPDATLTLPFELRQRSRLRAQLDDGRECALLLDRGKTLRGGDLLGSNCGLCIEIVAGAERLSVVRTPVAGTLARAAYHLGNRHVALEIRPGELRYLSDHVLDEMLEGLGLAVSYETLPFEPESGAYGHGH